MLLFDYIYYLCCRLYRRSKRERDLDEWKVSGIFAVAGLSCCFLLSIGFIIEEIFNLGYVNKINALIGLGVIFLLFLLRYNKFTNYDEIKKQVLTFSDKKRKRYNITAVIFMFIALPGMLLLAIFLGPTFK